jgi:hypothetical protein
MPYVHNGDDEVNEVGVQLVCDTRKGQESEKQLYAEWVRFRFCEPNRSIDLYSVSRGEANLQSHLSRSAESEGILDNSSGTCSPVPPASLPVR